MVLSPGSRLGPYEIVAPIGVGGMGQVYKALDTRLNRLVAIKQPLAPFSERFKREAHAIASLNHPHVCSLYDVGPDFLVMEFIEGAPLAGPVALNEALVLANQILDAMDAAHRQGIVHRDLKPANILVTKSGVKLLDFGLAKASAELSAAMTTMGGPATGENTILGTLQYMSPEQAEAKEADARSDIFSFGCVLYELITGHRAFDGASPGSIIAAILKDQPRPITELRPLVSKGIERVVQTCLEKDPDRRWQSAREVKHALEWVALDPITAPGDTAATKSRARSLRAWQAATAAALLAAVSAVMWAQRSPSVNPPAAVRFQVAPPAGVRLETYVALSPNGERLAFTATSADGIIHLWLRDLPSLESRMLPGTEGAQSAFWSPDNRHIAFGVRNQLKKIDVSGGPPQTLCEVEGPVGSGAWNHDGVILFGRRGIGGLNRVSESGGRAELVTPDGVFAGFPSFLSDGRRFIYFKRSPSPAIYSGSLDTTPQEQPTTPLFPAEVGARYVRASDGTSGFLMFVRDQTLLAQSFDEGTLALTGDPLPIDRVATVNQYPVFSASSNGRLAYRPGSRSTAQQLTWFTREGKPMGTLGERGTHEQLALSPDAARAAYREVDGTLAGDLWVTDLRRGASERFTFDRGFGGFPVWSPDSSRIAFRSALSIFQKSSTGGDAELLLKSDIQATPTSWSRDSKFLMIAIIGSNNTLYDLEVLATDGERRVSSFLKTQYNENQGAFSPDGRWVAYTSDESGRNEVYVRPFTPPGAVPAVEGKWPVSREGGSAPVWREDGRELFFRATASGAPMAVDVALTPTTFHADIPKQLFATPPVPWSVSADGKRFLVSMPPPEEVQVPITVDLNWEAALKRK